MNSQRFYADLPVLDEFSRICDLQCYRPLPDDWHIVVADVENSTGAIRSGLYPALVTCLISRRAGAHFHLSTAPTAAMPWPQRR